jgi:cell division protein FtsL
MIAGILLVIVSIILVAIYIDKFRRKKIEELHYNNVSVKALRISELQEVVNDPSLSENLRDAARNELHYRIKGIQKL